MIKAKVVQFLEFGNCAKFQLDPCRSRKDIIKGSSLKTFFSKIYRTCKKKANLKTYSFWHPSVSSYTNIESRAHKVCDFLNVFSSCRFQPVHVLLRDPLGASFALLIRRRRRGFERTKMTRRRRKKRRHLVCLCYFTVRRTHLFQSAL